MIFDDGGTLLEELFGSLLLGSFDDEVGGGGALLEELSFPLTGSLDASELGASLEAVDDL